LSLSTASQSQQAIAVALPALPGKTQDPNHHNPHGHQALADTLPGRLQFKRAALHMVTKQHDYIGQLAVLPADTVSNQMVPVTVADGPKKAIAFLAVSGTVLYDVTYRSLIDTPFAQNNVYQHTLQTRLGFLYKNEYPFRVYLTAHFSNSPFFRNYTDLNVQYNRTDFVRLMKNRVFSAIESALATQAGKLDSLKELISRKKTAIATLEQIIQKPGLFQQLVEEKERVIYNHKVKEAEIPVGLAVNSTKKPLAERTEILDLPKVTGLASREMDSASHIQNSAVLAQRKLDTLREELVKLENSYRFIAKAKEAKQQNLRREIEQASDVHGLIRAFRQANVPDSLLPKGYKLLGSIQSFSIGRSTANYSELSVKNVSITGLQVEYNSHYYYAFAAGKVDYRFRDYIVPNQRHGGQYVALIRLGKGTRDGNHLILTYYTGRRQFFNSSIATQNNRIIPEYNLAGITLEGLFKIDRNSFVVAEVAKSTLPYYSLNSLQQKVSMQGVTRFSDRSNEALAIRLQAVVNKTGTRLSGSLRYIGANFQSYSTFTTGASQFRWLAKLEQPFFKKKLTIASSVQQNDYIHPFVTAAYKTTSVLTSFQATLRVQRWPVLNVGYYPSYQLTKIGANSYTESRYYTLAVHASHVYRRGGVQGSSSIVFSQFYNEAVDSGFVYFNSKNLLFHQRVTFNNTSLFCNFSENSTTGYKIYTLEQNAQFAISKFFQAGGGVKMIRHSELRQPQWGSSGNLTVKVPKLGDFHIVIDKGFLPGLNRKLVENTTGRFTYFKTI
jgi:hypothetical protein